MFDKNVNPFKEKEIKEETSQTQETEEITGIEDTVDNEKQSQLQEKYDQLNQQYVRLAADFDNYRKRQDSERENLINFGTQNALTKLIEVLDNFERAQKTLEGVEDVAKVKESFQLIQKQTYDVLTKLGLEEIKAIGEEFDPNFHEAVMQTPTSEHPEHTVITELRKGYKMGEKVLRPAMVSVAVQE